MEICRFQLAVHTTEPQVYYMCCNSFVHTLGVDNEPPIWGVLFQVGGGRTEAHK